MPDLFGPAGSEVRRARAHGIPATRGCGKPLERDVEACGILCIDAPEELGEARPEAFGLVGLGRGQDPYERPATNPSGYVHLGYLAYVSQRQDFGPVTFSLSIHLRM